MEGSDSEHSPTAQPQKDRGKLKADGKHMPARHVYDDFETAFSSITSGSGKGREDHQKNVSTRQPLPGVPDSHSRELTELDLGDDQLAILSGSISQGDMLSGSQRGIRKGKSVRSLAWPRNSFELIDMSGKVRRQGSKRPERDSQESLWTGDCEEHTTSDDRESRSITSNAMPRLTPCHLERASFLTESTPEEISRQYHHAENRPVHSDSDRKVGYGCETLDSEVVRSPNPLNRAGTAPRNDHSDHQSVNTLSNTTEQASSYGDTRKLLGITSPESSNAGSRAQASALLSQFSLKNLAGDHKAGRAPRNDLSRHHNADHPSVNTPSNTAEQQSTYHKDGDRNPFRHSPRINHFPPQTADVSLIPKSTKGIKYQTYDEAPCFATEVKSDLERDISRELRRDSVQSSTSIKSISQDCRHERSQSSAEPDAETGNESVLGKLGKYREGFYDQSAITKTWLGPQQLNSVRVPIRRHTTDYSSKSATKLRLPDEEGMELQKLDRQSEDANDWETVREGRAAGERLDRYNMLGGIVNRATSSIANETDDGSASLFHYDRNDFSSTERIATHGGPIEYSNDYRYRDAGVGRLPVLLPSTKAISLNGEAVNTSRNISPFNSQGTIHTKHTNPFRKQQQDTLPDIIGPERVKSRADNVRSSHSWMNDFADPGPAVKHRMPQSESKASNISDDIRPDSYQCVMDLSLKRENSTETANSTSPLANRVVRSRIPRLPTLPLRAQIARGPGPSVIQGITTGNNTANAAATVQGLVPHERRSMSRLNILDEQEQDLSNLHRVQRLVPSEEWAILYTQEQLDRFRARALQDDNPYSRDTSSPLLVRRERSGSREPYDEKYVKSLSTKVLIACAILPPLLILYGEGYLDGLARLITRGEVRHFNKGHKVVAFWLGLIIGFIVMIGMGLAIGVAINRSLYH